MTSHDSVPHLKEGTIMGGYPLKERWGQFRTSLREQWVKFRKAHLVQDEEYDEKTAGQFPRLHAGPWGYSETGRRTGTVVSPGALGVVHAVSELSIEDRDPVSIHMSDKELVLTARMDTTIDTALVSGGVLLGGAGDCRSRGSVPGL
jgi:hypothetical protein